MKRLIKNSSIIICQFILCVYTLSACTLFSPIREIERLNYIEWRDDDGIFCLRASTNGAYGCGTVKLNGETFDTYFMLSDFKSLSLNFWISGESAQRLGFSKEIGEDNTVTDSFEVSYVVEEQVICSYDSSAELFGVQLGEVRLKAYSVEKAGFDIWEIMSQWEDEEERLHIYEPESNIFYFKCVTAKAYLNDGKEKTLTFRWLSDTKRFCIYEYVEQYNYQTITDDTPVLAAGVYELDGNNVKLYFTKDNLFGLENQYLYLAEKTY